MSDSMETTPSGGGGDTLSKFCWSEQESESDQEGQAFCFQWQKLMGFKDDW